MIASLLVLSASLAGQAHVDPHYSPRAGDRAVVGLHVKNGRPPGPKEYVSRASCYSSLESFRHAIEVPAPEEGEFLRSYPDSYQPRPGAPVEVLEIVSCRYRARGEEDEIDVARVRIVEGEFKDRVFFVAPWNVLRIVGKTEGTGGKPRE